MDQNYSALISALIALLVALTALATTINNILSARAAALKAEEARKTAANADAQAAVVTEAVRAHGIICPPHTTVEQKKNGQGKSS